MKISSMRFLDSTIFSLKLISKLSIIFPVR
jgi:hypothetical protein